MWFTEFMYSHKALIGVTYKQASILTCLGVTYTKTVDCTVLHLLQT